MKKFLKVLSTATLAAAMVLMTGCGGTAKTQMDTPTDITYDVSTGAFTFAAVDDGDTYQVGVGRVLNDVTGEALQSINGASQVTTDSGTYYIWSEQAGSVTGLKDNEGTGTISGSVVYREYSSSASTVGAVMSAADIPLGHYILMATANASGDLSASEAGTYEFVVSGTLAEPSGFTAQINDSGYMEITAPSSYYLNCLTVTGMPTKMEFEIMDGDTVVETIELEDFSYTNTVNGPNKAFSFNNNTVTGTTTLDSSTEYTVKVTAVGDGDTVLDSSAYAYFATSTAVPELATTYSLSASGSVGDYSISLSLGEDASGAQTYVLTASVNSVNIYVESGTFTADAEMGTYDEMETYPEGTTLTFTTTASDLETPVMDGLSLTVSRTESQGWGGTTISYGLSGTGSLDGESFEFAAGGNNMMGGWG